MKLQSITIKNVKSFRESVTFEPHKEFNVLIGSNGSGKSNLLEIINIVLRHYCVHSYRWSKERTDMGPRTRLDKEVSPFGLINQRLDKYVGDSSQSVIIFCLEVSETDVENLNQINKHRERLKEAISDFYFVDNSIKFFVNTEPLELIAGQQFQYEIKDNAFDLDPLQPKARFFLDYLRTIEGLRFLAQEIGFSLYPEILYISPFRGVSNLSLEQSLSDSSSYTERSEVMKSTSHSTYSLIKLATLYFAEKRRLFETMRGGWEKRWNEDKEVRFVTSTLAKIGYSWDLELIDANRNTYTIKLKKNGNDFLLSQASSGEVELINFILGLITIGLKGGIIIVDEPELHLHPKWISVLRGFFMQYAFTEKNQVMIITHSASFINTSTYPYITRVFKAPQGYSELHQVKGLESKETKDRLHFINATNNETIFFSDFVIMVEGDTDEIVFRRILEDIKKETDFSQNVEVMQVRGKTNYDKFNSFLGTLKIDSCFIGDIDNVAQMATGNATIKNILITNEKRIERLVIKNPGAQDHISLTQHLEEAISSGDLVALKGFYDYIISFRQKIRPDLEESERHELDAFIDSLFDKNIYLLKKGEIEDYFPDGYKGKDLDKVLALTQGAPYDQWKKDDGYNQLKGLLVEILRLNHIL